MRERSLEEKRRQTSESRKRLETQASHRSAMESRLPKEFGLLYAMQHFEDCIPQRSFDNFQFVNFTKIMSSNIDMAKKEAAFALSALMEIPIQFRATQRLQPPQHCLWIVGSASTLSKSATLWDELVIDAQNRKILFHANDYERLKKVIMRVKTELDQLQDSMLFSSAKWKLEYNSANCVS